MPYIVREHIIAFIQENKNILQGTSETYSIFLYRDFIGNDLDVSKSSNVSLAVTNSVGETVLMFSSPVIPGVSDILDVGSTANGDPGRISFEINAAQSRILDPGELNVAITLIYSDFFPNSKTYNLPVFKIGQVMGVLDPNAGGSSAGIFLGGPHFIIEHIDLDIPSTFGNMSVNSENPLEITKIIFRNLDKNLTRLTTLENFLVNRMDADNIQGIITLYDIDDPAFYCIYKIERWERIDITTGNGDDEDLDGIKIYVSAESVSSGPGVLETIWRIGNNVTFNVDTYGLTESTIKKTGILTYGDKNVQVVYASNGNASPTGIFITNTPYYDSYVMVEVNGISVELSDNTSSSDAYFSADNGITAVLVEEIRAGDQLIWNGSVAGFELEVGDEINLIYETNIIGTV